MSAPVGPNITQEETQKRFDNIANSAQGKFQSLTAAVYKSGEKRWIPLAAIADFFRAIFHAGATLITGSHDGSVSKKEDGTVSFWEPKKVEQIKPTVTVTVRGSNPAANGKFKDAVKGVMKLNRAVKAFISEGQVLTPVRIAYQAAIAKAAAGGAGQDEKGVKVPYNLLVNDAVAALKKYAESKTPQQFAALLNRIEKEVETAVDVSLGGKIMGQVVESYDAKDGILHGIPSIGLKGIFTEFAKAGIGALSYQKRLDQFVAAVQQSAISAPNSDTYAKNLADEAEELEADTNELVKRGLITKEEVATMRNSIDGAFTSVIQARVGKGANKDVEPTRQAFKTLGIDTSKTDVEQIRKNARAEKQLERKKAIQEQIATDEAGLAENIRQTAAFAPAKALLEQRNADAEQVVVLQKALVPMQALKAQITQRDQDAAQVVAMTAKIAELDAFIKDNTLDSRSEAVLLGPGRDALRQMMAQTLKLAEIGHKYGAVIGQVESAVEQVAQLKKDLIVAKAKEKASKAALAKTLKTAKLKDEPALVGKVDGDILAATTALTQAQEKAALSAKAVADFRGFDIERVDEFLEALATEKEAIESRLAQLNKALSDVSVDDELAVGNPASGSGMVRKVLAGAAVMAVAAGIDYYTGGMLRKFGGSLAGMVGNPFSRSMGSTGSGFDTVNHFNVSNPFPSLLGGPRGGTPSFPVSSFQTSFKV